MTDSFKSPTPTRLPPSTMITMTGAAAEDPPPTPPASTEWPTFQNTPPRQGVSPSVFLPPLTLRWSAGPYQTSRWSSPIFADGTLFETTWDGHLRARDPYSGTIQWDRKLGFSGARTGTPSFDNGVLYAAFA